MLLLCFKQSQQLFFFCYSSNNNFSVAPLRGQESAGIVTSEGKCARSFNVVKGMGMINNIFNDEAIKRLKGSVGIGHTRYSTSAASEEVNCQPFVVHTAHGALAVAHNGELVNCDSLRKMVGLFCFQEVVATSCVRQQWKCWNYFNVYHVFFDPPYKLTSKSIQNSFVIKYWKITKNLNCNVN